MRAPIEREPTVSSPDLDAASAELGEYLDLPGAQTRERLARIVASPAEASLAEPDRDRRLLFEAVAETLRPERSLDTEKIVSVVSAEGARAILDYGGGIGEETIALCGPGREIAFHEPEAALARFARWRFRNRGAAVTELPDGPGGPRYDAIVALRVASEGDPAPLARFAFDRLRRGGLLLLRSARGTYGAVERCGFRYRDAGGSGRRLAVYRKSPVQRLLAPARDLARALSLDRLVARLRRQAREAVAARAMARLGTEHVVCYLCGADEPRVLGRKDGLPLVRCGRCEFVYVTPRLTAEGLRRFYGHDYWFAERHRVGEPSLAERRRFDELLAGERLEAIRRFRDSGRFLDVGCAAGTLVRRARDAGFAAEGLELDPEVAARAAGSGDIRVRSGPLREQGYEGGTFSVVTLYDVIEHLPDPVADLRESRRILAPDGILVVETIRTNDNPSFDRDPIAWPDTRPAEHIYLFSESSLREVLARAGFEIVHQERPDQKYGFRTLCVCRSAAGA